MRQIVYSAAKRLKRRISSEIKLRISFNFERIAPLKSLCEKTRQEVYILDDNLGDVSSITSRRIPNETTHRGPGQTQC
jgi:hypothetical protein